MTDDSAKDIADLSFEEALEQLEKIVQQLEQGDVPLDRSIELYGRGDKLRAQCEERLKAAQARIDKIQLDSDGQPAGTEPLDPD